MLMALAQDQAPDVGQGWMDGWLAWQGIWVCLLRSGWTVCSLDTIGSVLFGGWPGGTLNVSRCRLYTSLFQLTGNFVAFLVVS